jgi:hypothetical protein
MVDTLLNIHLTWMKPVYSAIVCLPELVFSEKIKTQPEFKVSKDRLTLFIGRQGSRQF